MLPNMAESELATMAIRKLTTSQQVRLTQYLDDELLTVERDVNKRTDPDSPIPSLIILIDRLTPIIDLIMSIPPSEPTGYIRIQYLLRFTSGLREWLSGYSVTGHGVLESKSGAQKKVVRGSSKATVEASRNSLKKLLGFIEMLDLAWQAVLRGESLNGITTTSDAKPEVKKEDIVAQETGAGGSSKNLVSVTDKIRLRSSILSLRERILSWAEKQSGLLSGTKDDPPVEESETDLSALEDEVDQKSRSEQNDGGNTDFRWRATVVNSMRGTLEMLDL